MTAKAESENEAADALHAAAFSFDACCDIKRKVNSENEGRVNILQEKIADRNRRHESGARDTFCGVTAKFVAGRS